MNLSNNLHNKLIQYLVENTQFTNWVLPSDEDLALEYKLEYDYKDLGYLIQNRMEEYGYDVDEEIFPNAASFIKAAKTGRVVTVTKSMDNSIEYRSGCGSVECLISLIKGYASYPKYRNEDTIKAMSDGFDQNKPMKMPIVLQFTDGVYRVMGGNTRMDMAFIKGINPKVLIIDLRKFGKKI